MNGDDILELWKEQKMRIEVSDDFADTVMSQLHERGPHGRTSVFDFRRLTEIISSNRAATAAAVALGAVAGIIRLSILVLSLLAV